MSVAPGANGGAEGALPRGIHAAIVRLRPDRGVAGEAEAVHVILHQVFEAQKVPARRVPIEHEDDRLASFPLSFFS